MPSGQILKAFWLHFGTQFEHFWCEFSNNRFLTKTSYLLHFSHFRLCQTDPTIALFWPFFPQLVWEALQTHCLHTWAQFWRTLNILGVPGGTPSGFQIRSDRSYGAQVWPSCTQGPPNIPQRTTKSPKWTTN